jgi:adenosylhomocysteinase
MLCCCKRVVCGYGDVGKGTAASFRGAGSITVTEIDQFVLYKLQWTVLKLKKLDTTVIATADIIITTTGNKDSF